MCISKKTSRIPFKMFESLLEKYTEQMVLSLLGSLVTGCYEGKTPFWRSECCRLLNSILKRKGFSENIQSFILKECKPLASNITKILVSEKADTDSKKDNDRRTKRLKPILQCAKELALMFANAAFKKSKDTDNTVSALRLALKSVAEESPNLAPMVTGILTSLGGTSAPATDMVDTDTKKRKTTGIKVNGGSNTENDASLSLLRDWGKEDEVDAKKRKIAKQKKNSKLYKI